MYICICNAVTDRDIASAVHEGARCIEELEQSLLVSTCCGKCRDAAIACLDSHRGARPHLTLAASA